MKSFNNKQLQKSKQARAAHSLVHFAAVSSQRPGGGGGGGRVYSWEYLMGVYRPLLQILTLFQTKNSSHPFSVPAFKK